MATQTLATQRLILRALDADDLDAWVARDADALQRRTGALFPVPVDAPPLFADDLPALRDQLRQDGGDGDGQVWLLIEKDTGEPVGVVGFSTPATAGEERVATTGYSAFPRFQGQGYTTEALRELVKGVPRLRATIPPGNRASIRVAEKLGMVNTGAAVDPDVGDVLVYETPAS
jgi:[ribosomal protein S5]-alanine N-acetyltransferase